MVYNLYRCLPIYTLAKEEEESGKKIYFTNIIIFLDSTTDKQNSPHSQRWGWHQQLQFVHLFPKAVVLDPVSPSAVLDQVNLSSVLVFMLFLFVYSASSEIKINIYPFDALLWFVVAIIRQVITSSGQIRAISEHEMARSGYLSIFSRQIFEKHEIKLR